MALVLKNGGVVLHIPKTAGNWVAHVLRESRLIRSRVGHKHADVARTMFAMMPRRARALSGRRSGIVPGRRARIETPFIFTFVRNPLSWYESWYKYQSQDSRGWEEFGTPGQLSDWHPNSILNGLGHRDFNVFVERVVEERPGYVTELFFAYTSPEVSFVGKQESIREDLCRALDLAREEYDRDYILSSVPVGVSDRPRTRIEWRPALRKKVIELEWPAMVRFGYAEQL